VGYIVDALIRNAPKFPFCAALQNYNIPFGAGEGNGFLFEISSFSQFLFHFVCLLHEYPAPYIEAKYYHYSKKTLAFIAHLLSLSSIEV
jgi:hypothetical protein